MSLATRLHYRPNGLAFSPDGSKLYVADSVIGFTAITEYPVDRATQVHSASHWVVATRVSPTDSWCLAMPKCLPQALGKASFVFTPATLGCELGRNPNRSRMGNEGECSDRPLPLPPPAPPFRVFGEF